MMHSEDPDFRLANQKSILELIERDELLVMEKLWPTRRVNMVEFIKIMISVVHHKQCELLYLVMGLIELYKDVVATCQQNELSLADVTSYVCQVEPASNAMIPQYQIPEPKKFTLNKTRIREIDVVTALLAINSSECSTDHRLIRRRTLPRSAELLAERLD